MQEIPIDRECFRLVASKARKVEQEKKGMKKQRLARKDYFVSRSGKGMKKQRLARKDYFVSRSGKGIEKAASSTEGLLRL